MFFKRFVPNFDSANLQCFSTYGSNDEKAVCQKILENMGLKGYQVLRNVSPE